MDGCEFLGSCQADYHKYTYQPSIPDKHFNIGHWNYAGNLSRVYLNCRWTMEKSRLDGDKILVSNSCGPKLWEIWCCVNHVQNREENHTVKQGIMESPGGTEAPITMWLRARRPAMERVIGDVRATRGASCLTCLTKDRENWCENNR